MAGRLHSPDELEAAIAAYEAGERVRGEPRWEEHAHARRLGGAGIRRGIRGGGGMPWTPLRLSTLAHWYRGEPSEIVEVSNAISTHWDLEAAADLTQAVVGNRPAQSDAIAVLKNRPGGVYTAASSHYINSALFAPTLAQPFTVVLAWTHTTLAAAQYAMAGGGLAGGSSRWFVRANSTALEVHAGVGTAIASITLATATAYTGIFVVNGTSTKMRVNGASVYAGATNVGANACGDLILGRETVASYHDGAIAEGMLCTGDLTTNAGALAQAEAYLAARYL
jgi:hypothetical protein